MNELPVEFRTLRTILYLLAMLQGLNIKASAYHSLYRELLIFRA